jgi:hypothetical protein
VYLKKKVNEDEEEEDDDDDDDKEPYTKDCDCPFKNPITTYSIRFVGNN